MNDNNNENEFTHTDGVVYVAVDSNGHCSQCSFFNINCNEIERPSCMRYARTDRNSIIWKPKADQ